MIKEGDIVVCIRPYVLKLTYIRKMFIVNKGYKVLSVGSDMSYYVDADTELVEAPISYKYNFGVRFYSEQQCKGLKHLMPFSHYFITLAEWREQQIKSVIDD
jgi:hypothetical protein